MTVSSTINRVSYAGDGVTAIFPVPFYFLEDSHLRVVLSNNTTGVETILIQNTDYTVTGAGNQAGGTVTVPNEPAVGYTLLIRRVVPATQETDYVSNDPFPAESHERALDKLTMIAQQVLTDTSKAIKVPETDPDPDILPPAASRANKLMAFDSDGQPTVVIPVAGDVTAFALDLLNHTDPTLGAALVGRALRHINTMAELRTLTGIYDGDTVYLVSYLDWSTFTNPVGGGEFVWDAASTEADDLGYIIQPTGFPTGRWKRKWEGKITVEQFGANPFSEAVNSRPAFDAAVAFSRTVKASEIEFGPGTFMIDRAVDVFTSDPFYQPGVGVPFKNGIRFKGAGSWVTSVFCSNAGGPFKMFRFDGNEDLNTNNLTPVAQWGSGLSGVMLKSDSTTFNANTAALYLRACWNFESHDVQVQTMPGDAVMIDTAVSAVGADDADACANIHFENFLVQDIGGRAFNNEKSRSAAVTIKRWRGRNCFRGGIYIGASSAWVSDIELDAQGSRGNTDAYAIKAVRTITEANTRNMHFKNLLIENCEWGSIDIEHCDSGSIDGAVFHPYMNPLNADVILQPRVMRFGHIKVGTGNVVRNFRVRNVRIQDYSTDGTGREFQAFTVENDAQVRVEEISVGSTFLAANVFVLGSGTAVSLNGEALTLTGIGASFAHLQATVAGAASTGAGAVSSFATNGGTLVNDAKGLFVITSNKAVTSRFIVQTRAEVAGEVALGGLSTSHNRIRVAARVNAGTAIPIMDIPFTVSAASTTARISFTCPIPVVFSDALDIEVTVFGGAATVFFDVGSRVRWTLI